MKRNLLISMLVMLVMLVGVFTVGTVAASAAENVAVMGIELDKTTATYDLRSGKTFFGITATIIPGDASNQDIFWMTSDDSIVEIMDSETPYEILYRGKKEGTATITAITKNGKSASCVVTVVDGRTIVLDDTTFDLKDLPRGWEDLRSKQIVPSVNDFGELIWSVDDPTVATIDESGMLTWIKEGVVTVTATNKEGTKSDSCKVTLTDNRTITLNHSEFSYKLNSGSYYDLNATLNFYGDLVWTVSDTNVAEFKIGLGVTYTGTFRGLNVGTATITATTKDGRKSASCVVTVTDERTIQFFNSSWMYNMEGTFPTQDENGFAELTVDTNASATSLVWSVDKPSVVQIKDTLNTKTIKFKGMNPGSAKIKVSTKDGLHSAEINIVVVGDEIRTFDLPLTLTAGSTIASVLPKYDANNLGEFSNWIWFFVKENGDFEFCNVNNDAIVEGKEYICQVKYTPNSGYTVDEGFYTSNNEVVIYVNGVATTALRRGEGVYEINFVGASQHTFDKWGASSDKHYKQCSGCVDPDCAEIDWDTDEEHSCANATCVNYDVICDICGLPAIINNAPHSLKDVEAIQPTCTEKGAVAHKECTLCGAWFDEEGNEIIDEDREIPIVATNHSFGEMIDEIAATCSGTGTKAHKVCIYCEKNFDADGNVIADLTLPVDPNGHKFTSWNSEIPATCVGAGTKAYMTCTLCEKNYESDGVTEIADLTIPTNDNHDMATEWTGVADGHYHECKRVGCEYHDTLVGHSSSGAATEQNAETCTDCGYTITPALGHITCSGGIKQNGQAATCTTDGWNDYYKCSGCEKLYEDAACTILISDFAAWKIGDGKITSEGHKYGAWVSNGDGTHTRTCSVDNSHKENGNCSGGTATCTTKKTCQYCNTAYGDFAVHSHGSAWEKDESGHWNECVCGDKANFAGHNPDRANATETDPIKCTVCEYIITPALGHTTCSGGIKQNGQAATCTTDGWNDYYKCSGCNKIYTDAACTPANEIPDLAAWKTGAGKIAAAHTDSNNDGKCDTCGKDMPTTPGTDDPNAGNTEDPTDDNDGLPTGAIIAIVAGSVVVGGAGIFALVWFVIKKKTWAEFLAIFKK